MLTILKTFNYWPFKNIKYKQMHKITGHTPLGMWKKIKKKLVIKQWGGGTPNFNDGNVQKVLYIHAAFEFAGFPIYASLY